MPHVNTDHPIFDFQDEDYELTVKDKTFLFKNQAELGGMSEKQFERVIDCLEKVAFMYHND